MINTNEIAASKVSICQTCGDKGFEDLLLCCSKCQISEEHRYCLAQIPEVDDENFTYTCAKCASSSGNQTSFKRSFGRALCSAPSPKKNFRKQCMEPAVAVVQDLKSAPVVKEEAEVPKLPISIPLDTSVAETFVENVQALHDRNENDSSPSQTNQSAAVAQEIQICEANPLQISVCAPPVQDVPLLVDPNESNYIPHCPSNGPSPVSVACPKYVYAQPIIDPAWRGSFQMSKKKFGEFKAHLSDKACLQVVEAAKLMPVVLSVRMLPRLDIWPKSFHISAPTDENIGLYFFPESESVVKAFDGLMRNIINCDLALKVLFDNVELLIFSSSQLPPQYRRFMGKYYLWGVFRGRKDLSSHESGDNHITKNIGCMPFSAQGNTKMSDSEPLRMSPLSPLSATGSYCSGSHYSQ